MMNQEFMIAKAAIAITAAAAAAAGQPAVLVWGFRL